MSNIFSLGNPGKKDKDEKLAHDILNWSSGNCSKDELKKKHENSLGWLGGKK